LPTAPRPAVTLETVAATVAAALRKLQPTSVAAPAR